MVSARNGRGGSATTEDANDPTPLTYHYFDLSLFWVDHLITSAISLYTASTLTISVIATCPASTFIFS
jgi:hypothetical protein